MGNVIGGLTLPAIRSSGVGRAGGGGGAAQPLTLPYTYNISSCAESSGGLSNVAGWTLTSGYNDLSITSAYNTDGNSWRPSGVDQHALNSNAANNGSCYFTFPNSKVIDPTLTGLRFATISYTNSGAFGSAFCDLQDTVPETVVSYLMGAYHQGYNPDKFWTQARWETDTTQSYTPQPGVNLNENRYCWVRVEINFGTGKMSTAQVRAQDDSTLQAVETDIDATGVALGHVPTGLNAFKIGTWGGAYQRFLGFWIGSLTDAWPTTTLDSTSEDYA